jgi:hypothetical protein
MSVSKKVAATRPSVRAAKRASVKKKKMQKNKSTRLPELDGIYNEIMDSYALLYVGYEMVLKEDDEHGYAVVLLHRGVNLLKQASIRLDEANSRLLGFYSDSGVQQERQRWGE